VIARPLTMLETSRPPTIAIDIRPARVGLLPRAIWKYCACYSVAPHLATPFISLSSDASAVVAFFRSMGGSLGVSALGALLSAQVAAKVTAGLDRLHIPTSNHESHSIPDLSKLPAPVRQVFEHAFGTSTADLFLIAVPFALAALAAVMFIREVPLRTTIERADELTEAVAR
jgi:hypothetical protein